MSPGEGRSLSELRSGVQRGRWARCCSRVCGCCGATLLGAFLVTLTRFFPGEARRGLATAEGKGARGRAGVRGGERFSCALKASPEISLQEGECMGVWSRRGELEVGMVSFFFFFLRLEGS